MRNRSVRALGLASCLILIPAALAPAQEAGTPEVKTVEFEAPSVGRTMKFNIVLPEGYEGDANARYPVLYMLHGFTSNYTAWAKLGVPRVVRDLDLNLIVVMPDVGNSWYINWAESEDGQKNAWEDFIVKDLIGHVDANYRTVARREGRAINGLSMGGYGGLTLGLRHPDLFCSIGSQSGALGFARGIAERLEAGDDLSRFRRREASDEPNPDIGIAGFSSQAERSPKGKMFTTAEQARAHDPFSLVAEVPVDKLPHIYLDCGTEDRLIESSVDFAKLLTEKKIPFTYSESAGGHTPPYWAREVSQAMAVQYVILRRNLASFGLD